MSLAGRSLFITGGSRGIGRAIALRAARDGARVALAAKTTEPHPKLEGTLHSVAAEVEAAGGQALVLRLDVRDEAAVQAAVQRAAEHFGGLDIVVNNASAIQLTGTLETPLKRFDLMHQVNARGTFAVSQAALPHLLRSDRPHLLTLSPPLNLDPRWLGPHVAYTMSKYGMTLCTMGLAEEFRGRVAANCLWPRTTIATAAIEWLGGEALRRTSRHAEIVADAAAWILSRPVSETGRCYLDEDALREAGVEDFTPYAVDPEATLTPDLFL
jgi:citronellol/citronellal dehydrogenase